MHSQIFDRVQARAIRHALNPRTAPLRIDLVPHLLKSLLSSSGLPLEEIDEWGEGLERHLTKHRSEVDKALRFYSADLANATHEGYRLVGMVLAALAAKYNQEAPVLDGILDGLETPRPYFPSAKMQRWYRLAWMRKAIETTPVNRSESIQKKIIDRLLELGLASPPAKATRWYHETLKQWSRDQSDEQRSRLRLLAEKTGLPTATVLKGASHGEGSDGKSRRKLYGHLELPLPLSVMPTPAADIISILNSEFPWLTGAIAAVAMDLLVAEHYRQRVVRLSPKLLYGAPGNGKTTFICRVAELVAQPTAMLNAAGAASSRILLGVPRGYSTARSSFPLELMAMSRLPHCIVNIDEIDKAGSGTQNGNFADALLGFLEPTSSHRYFDEYAMSECDFSHVSWLLTCNDPTKIGAPLLSRVEAIHCAQPEQADMGIIAAHTMEAIRKEFRLDRSVDVLDAQAQSEVLFAEGRVKSAREMTRVVRMKFAETLDRRFRPSVEPPQTSDKSRLLMH